MSPTELTGEQLVETIRQSALDKKAEDFIVADMRSIHGVADWFIVCQGDNVMHTRAIMEGIVGETKKNNTPPWYSEGVEEARWILIDYTDVVVHIMVPEVRDYYRIEMFWNELKESAAEENPAGE